MPLIEIFKQTLTALWENKLRSFLTMFGIVWGITSVIVLVGLGIGFNLDQKQRLRTIGTDIAGSVRLPSSHCGLASLKPTHGRVAHLPPDFMRMAGPMGRRVEDVELKRKAAGTGLRHVD